MCKRRVAGLVLGTDGMTISFSDSLSLCASTCPATVFCDILNHWVYYKCDHKATQPVRYFDLFDFPNRLDQAATSIFVH